MSIIIRKADSLSQKIFFLSSRSQPYWSNHKSSEGGEKGTNLYILTYFIFLKTGKHGGEEGENDGEEDGEEKGKRIFHQLVHIPKPCISQGWVKLKWATKSSS